MWREYNPNPARKKTDDCTVRAICKAIGLDWETVYVRLAMAGLRNGDMMHKNYVWGGLLEDCGFKRITLPDRCPKCYTVAQFPGNQVEEPQEQRKQQLDPHCAEQAEHGGELQAGAPAEHVAKELVAVVPGRGAECHLH